MLLRSALAALLPVSQAPRARSEAARPRRTVLEVAALEDRTVPSTFTVWNLADAGAGSLRQAVLDANAQPGADAVRFADGLQGTIALTGGQLDVTSE
jgi:hypothetical protein